MRASQALHRTDWPERVTRHGWLGAELCKDGLSFDLNAGHLAIMRDLVQKCAVSRLHYRAISAKHFQHRLLEPLFTAMLEELKWGKGIVFLRGIPVDEYSPDDLRRLFWGIGTRFGTALCQKKFTGEYMLDIAPRQEIERGFSGHQELDFHTDYTEIGALLCVQPAASGGTNVYASSLMLWDIFEREFPEFMPTLQRGFRTWRLNEHSPGDDPITPHHVPVFGAKDGLRSVYYVWRTAEAVGVYLNRPLGESDRAAIRTIYDVLSRDELHFHAQLRRGEIVLFNNFEVLHARTRFSETPAAPRHLLRLWLQGTPPRALPDLMRIHNNPSGLLGYDPWPGGTAAHYADRSDDPANVFMRNYFADFYSGRQTRRS